MLKKTAFVVASSLFAVQAAQAADPVATPPEQAARATAERSGWALQITPYMWAAGLDGHISPFRHGPTIRVEKPFSEVMSDLNFGGFLHAWGRNGRFVFFGDVMYVDTSESHGAGPLPGLRLPGQGVAIPAGAGVDARADTRQFTATLLGGYRLLDAPGFTLDALAGLRFWHISNRVTVTASHPAIGSRSGTYGENFGWVDPILGLRAFLPRTGRLSLQAQAEIGGFGVGADLTWSVLGTVNYTVNDHLSVSAGYKVLNVDYDHGGHVYDTQLSGPVLGATWRF